MRESAGSDNPCRRLARLTHPQPLGGEPGAFGQRGELGPDDVLGDTAHSRGSVKAAIGAGDDPLRVADHLRYPLDPVGDGLGVLDEIGQAVDDPGDEDLIVGQRLLLEDMVFVRMARVGEGEEEGADPGLL